MISRLADDGFFSLPNVDSRFTIFGHAQIPFPCLLPPTIQVLLTWSIGWNKWRISHIRYRLKSENMTWKQTIN